ncbi:dipeptidase [Kineothrix sp. MB12-C1]|uniref:dipeptidase n=1 Tax=Kineothrix sp. MB12-C1 TaxID=3070215 RepID=UPI0027D1FE64|nr:dipeptidase [Kineothrix sp. MB12-C1]WMC91856.1 dipeptidase [Kineothrix sp. MB12-C1]
MKAVDMHCDTISKLYEMAKEKREEDLLRNHCHIDLQKLKKGDALLQNFAIFIDKGKVDNPFEEFVRMADYYYMELKKNGDIIAPVFCWNDIEQNKRDGKISALLTVEEGAVCKGDTAYVRSLYRLGVRMMTLTWNYVNEIGHPNINKRSYEGEKKENTKIPFYKIADMKNGLTEVGKEVVEEMERIGMIIDVSHLSDKGFYDVLSVTNKPFVASHSNARTICSWVRNLTDDMIRKLALRGGVIGLNFCPDFLTDVSESETDPGTIASIVEHAKYITNVGGIDCLGLGSDFDGIEGHGELPDYSYLPMLSDALMKAGFRESDVEKIFHGNVLSIYKELL